MKGEGHGRVDQILSVLEAAPWSFDIKAGTSSLCIFALDGLSVPGDVISELADEIGCPGISSVPDMRIPGWIDGADAAVVSNGPNQSFLKELSLRGCRAHVLPLEGKRLTDDTISAIAGLCALASSIGLMDAESALRRTRDEVSGMASALTDAATRVADSIRGGVPAFYSVSEIGACSRHAMLALRSKGLAFCGELPEFDHNELVGWSDPNVHAPDLRMVVINGCSGGGLVPIIVDCMREVLEENGREVVVADTVGGSSLTMNVAGIVLAQLISERIRWARYRYPSSSTISSTIWTGRSTWISVR